ncbi:MULTISPECIES: response regulator transcription factor [Microbacterium]|uniref:response regulator transcription factor n=1 Tax=Microbacterium TaxID=33882 RepID=UPI00217DBFD9|nr:MULTISPECIES: response regulator transcription factor [Microbacterium]UWF77541.1 response regulator transcription factor [Microbacterium neungamense]WCM55710.1 response regulator transcription factor [Microbacterium sp. EF45047]
MSSPDGVSPAIRILIVDDDALVRQALRGILSAAPDLEVIGEASGGGEAIEIARRHRPDVVLMDVRMPGMPGDEATTALREQLPDTRVIAITSFDSGDYVMRMLEAGAQGFLLKDAEPADFIRAAHAVMKGDGFVSPRSTAHLIARFAAEGDEAARRIARERFGALSPREKDVAVLAAEGASNQEIADRLHLSVATVKTHLEAARIALGARNRVLLCIAVERAGFGPGAF